MNFAGYFLDVLSKLHDKSLLLQVKPWSRLKKAYFKICFKDHAQFRCERLSQQAKRAGVSDIALVTRQI